jgi:hypothetical protein
MHCGYQIRFIAFAIPSSFGLLALDDIVLPVLKTPQVYPTVSASSHTLYPGPPHVFQKCLDALLELSRGESGNLTLDQSTLVALFPDTIYDKPQAHQKNQNHNKPRGR